MPERPTQGDFRITKKDLHVFRKHSGKYTEETVKRAFRQAERALVDGYPLDITEEGISFASMEQLLDNLSIDSTLKVAGFGSNSTVTRRLFEDFVGGIRIFEAAQED